MPALLTSGASDPAEFGEIIMYTLGIDIGSSSSKAVVMKDGKDVVAQAVIQVGTGTSGPARVMEKVFQDQPFTIKDMDYVVATGYGRFSVTEANKQISEISCHAKGIFYQHPGTRTVKNKRKISCASSNC